MSYVALFQVVVLVLAAVFTVAAARRSRVREATSWVLGGILFWGLVPWECGALDFYPGSATCHSPLGLSASVHGGTDPVARLVGGELMMLAASRLAVVGLLVLVAVVAVGRRVADRNP